MNKISLFVVHIFILIFITSCGSDKLASSTKSATTNALGGAQCGCNASYSPVCGNNNVTYDNQCIASCYSVSQTSQGNCICSESLIVCGQDNIDYTECEARNFRVPIKKYSPCSSASY